MTDQSEINRLWSHGLHEERLFYDRLNYFTAMQVGLLGVFAILYNKNPTIAVFLPLMIVALLLTLIWHVVQVKHWRYCVHVNAQIKVFAPEFKRTLSAYAERDFRDGLNISRPLAFFVPGLFAFVWGAFIAGLLISHG